MYRWSFIVVSVVATIASSGPALADASFDACVRKLCTSTTQADCWLKAGAAICDRDQISCSDLPDNAPAKIVRKNGARWEVITRFGKGWVSDRMTMVSGDKC